MKDFYLTLPSTTPYPGNTVTDFKVQLQNPIYLDRQYEMGLSEIHFLNAYRRLNENSDRVFLFGEIRTNNIDEINNNNNNNNDVNNIWEYLDNNILSLTIPNIYYTTLDMLIGMINTIIIENSTQVSTQSISLQYNKQSNSIEILSDTEKRQYLKFSYALAKILGLKDNLWYGHLFNKVDSIVNYIPNISYLNVFCNVIEPEFVGNTKQNLLRNIITHKENIGTYVNKVFIRPYYKKIIHRSFNTIHIWILDELGRTPAIDCSELVIIVHLKPI